MHRIVLLFPYCFDVFISSSWKGPRYDVFLALPKISVDTHRLWSSSSCLYMRDCKKGSDLYQPPDGIRISLIRYFPSVQDSPFILGTTFLASNEARMGKRPLPWIMRRLKGSAKANLAGAFRINILKKASFHLFSTFTDVRTFMTWPKRITDSFSAVKRRFSFHIIRTL